MKYAMVLAGLGLATAASAEIPKILPGEWEISTTMVMKTMPNMSPEVAAAIRQHQGKPVVNRHCVTPEDAARGPEAAIKQANCTVQNSSYGGGRMAAETVCREGTNVIRSKVTGSYTATSYDIDGAMNATGNEAGPMAMTMHVSGRRLAAACTAKSH